MVQGRNEKSEDLLVLVAQQILLVPNMVLSSQAQLFKLRQVEACKRFQVVDVGKRMYIARGVEAENLLCPKNFDLVAKMTLPMRSI